MKNLLFIFICLFSSSLLFNSCTKDESLSNIETNNSTPTYDINTRNSDCEDAESLEIALQQQIASCENGTSDERTCIINLADIFTDLMNARYYCNRGTYCDYCDEFNSEYLTDLRNLENVEEVPGFQSILKTAAFLKNRCLKDCKPEEEIFDGTN